MSCGALTSNPQEQGHVCIYIDISNTNIFLLEYIDRIHRSPSRCIQHIDRMFTKPRMRETFSSRHAQFSLKLFSTRRAPTRSHEAALEHQQNAPSTARR